MHASEAPSLLQKTRKCSSESGRPDLNGQRLSAICDGPQSGNIRLFPMYLDRTQAKLTSKNSSKVGRGEGRAPVMLRMAPREPYSPFKTRYPSPDRGERMVRQSREDLNNSTDPRQVIAVLAELSGNNIFEV